MKQFFVVSVAIACMFFIGCSSKQITYDPLGKKMVTTRTNEDIYHEQQANAWSGYYEALKNPPVIATIQQLDGTILTINSQIPPPAPIIRQHQNQYIKPVTDIIKWGIGGVILDRTISAVVSGAGDVMVNNSGDGTVITDRSDNIASKKTSTVSPTVDRSDHSAVADPTVVLAPDPVLIPPAETVIIEQPPYNDPLIIEKDVLFVPGTVE